MMSVEPTPFINAKAKPRVLVTRKWPDAVERRLSARFDTTLNLQDAPLAPEVVRAALGQYDAVLPTVTDHLGPDVLDVVKPQTKILSNYGVGTTHICEASARKLGVAVTNTPDVVSECTADLAMTLLLSVARRTSEAERALRDATYGAWSTTHLAGTKVSGKTLGIVGFGSVGQAMARRARHGFGMDVVVYDTQPISATALGHVDARRAESLDDLLPQSDFVSLHCTAGLRNRHMINGRRFDQMKETAFLINTASSALVDEHALTQALMFETIGGAALDLCDASPRLAPQLLECDGLVAVPHMGSATQEAREAMGFRVFDNLVDFFEGRDPRDRVI